MKTVVVLQPSYLPWLGYFDQMAKADVFVLYDNVQFDKHGWRNRNRIKSPNGEPHWLTVPVLHSGQGPVLNCEIGISKDLNWSHKHLGTIAQFYARAPHAKQVTGELAEILSQKWNLLIDLNLALIEWFRRQLAIGTPIIRSSTLNLAGNATEKLVNICHYFEATHYLTGDVAKDYLDLKPFRESGIEVVWHNYLHPIYHQIHGPFVSHLSALDLLLNLGAQQGKKFFAENIAAFQTGQAQRGEAEVSQ